MCIKICGKLILLIFLRTILVNRILLHILSRSIERHFLCTTANRKTMLGIGSPILCYSIPPVGIWEANLVRTILDFQQSLFRIGKCSSSVLIKLIGISSILISIQHLRDASWLRERYRTIILHLYLTSLTTLGSNEDNTIGSTRTINGSRSILQYGNTLNIIRIQATERTIGNTIYYNQWGCITHCTLTTNKNIGIISTRLTCTGIGDDTRCLTSQGISNIGSSHLTQLVTTNRRYRTSKGCLLLGTITYDNQLIQKLVVCLQSNLATLDDGYTLISNIGNYNRSIAFLDLQGIVTIKIGNSAILGIAFFYNACTNNRFSLFIYNHTFDSGTILLNRLYRRI